MLSVVMLSVILSSVFMLSVILSSGVMLSVLEPIIYIHLIEWYLLEHEISRLSV